MTIITILAFILGTIFGSFFYTLALRFIDGTMEQSPKQALTSRSSCTNCGKTISAIGLIPIVGYIFYRGKCKNCKSKISIKYPLAEIVFGTLAVFLFQRYSINFYSASLFIIASITLTITIVDIKKMIIPNSLVLALLFFSIYPVISSGDILSNLYGAGFLFLFFIIILLIFPGSFGFGDIKYATVIGFFFGFELSIIVLESALISGSIFGIIYAILKGKKLMSKIAFGPFLTLGAFISFIYGREIILLYLNFIN